MPVSQAQPFSLGTLAALLALPLFLMGFGLLFPWLYRTVMCYVVLPWRARGEPSAPTEELSEADLQRLPAEQQATLGAAGKRLPGLGFALATYGRAFGRNAWIVASCWLNAREGVSALVMATRSELPDMPPCSGEVVAFCTEFTDGSAIVTVNDGNAAFVPDPKCDTLRWPGMHDLVLLYRVHAGRLERERGSREPVLPRPADTARHLVKRELETLWRQVDAGYLWFDAGANVFRRTLKGSYLMYWKTLRPWKQRLAAAQERKLRRVLQDLGMGTPEEYSPDPKDADAPPALSYESPGPL